MVASLRGLHYLGVHNASNFRWILVLAELAACGIVGILVPGLGFFGTDNTKRCVCVYSRLTASSVLISAATRPPQHPYHRKW